MKDHLETWTWIVTLLIIVLFYQYLLDQYEARIQSLESQVQSLTSKP